ncbi:MAG: 3-phosphoshikimate 1-carboxyvinyltransferase [Eubacteriales bacterium]|nr:3-phosphoshikimate 1-carboxyvinyltransferase [Eubacteriales bacterium]
MPERLIRPGHLKGSLTPPPSKSDAHRALICAALAGDLALVHGIGLHPSDDLIATKHCLQVLMQAAHNEHRQPVILDCHESGTTLRLLIPVAAALGVTATFIGSGRLPQRPLQEYQNILGGKGVELEFPTEGSLPLTIRGRLQSGSFHVPGHISSQYLSGLLLALPLVEGDSTIELTSPLESAPYVEMTRRTLSEFGVAVTTTEAGFVISGPQKLTKTTYTVEKDYSQAAFWLTANYLGSEIKLSDLPVHSAQGDRAILTILAGLKRPRAAGEPYIIDSAQIPDLVPILAVAAGMTPGVTRIINGARLRLKESDRLTVTAAVLNAIGADITIEGDTLVIKGQHMWTGGQADSHGDHRIAMALAIAGLSTQHGVTISHAGAVRKSYPDFFQEFERLGGDCHELHVG